MQNKKDNGGTAGNKIKKDGEEMAAAEKKQQQNPVENDAKVNETAQNNVTDGKAAEPASNFPEAEAQTRLKELEAKLKEAEDKYLRTVAEMDNSRKRMGKEMENLRLNVMTDTVSPFLQVFDHFSMAVAASASSNNLKSLIEGMKMIQNEFDKAFSELGIVKIDAIGMDFDPNLHEAVSQEASDTVPAGKVIRQWSFGYKTPLRLLKPAMVVVSSGPQAKNEE